MYGGYLVSSDLQFGFQKKLDCPSAIFMLMPLFVLCDSKSSNIYIASLDASKAFDSVNHFRLCPTLISEHLPFIFIKIIINRYIKLEILMRLDGVESNHLRILSGVRQYGVLSPLLFNIYVDGIINKLENTGLGRHYVNCSPLMYYAHPDDLLVISSFVLHLQRTLDLCCIEGNYLVINFNYKNQIVLI